VPSQPAFQRQPLLETSTTRSPGRYTPSSRPSRQIHRFQALLPWPSQQLTGQADFWHPTGRKYRAPRDQPPCPRRLPQSDPAQAPLTSNLSPQPPPQHRFHGPEAEPASSNAATGTKKLGGPRRSLSGSVRDSAAELLSVLRSVSHACEGSSGTSSDRPTGSGEFRAEEGARRAKSVLRLSAPPQYHL